MRTTFLKAPIGYFFILESFVVNFGNGVLCQKINNDCVENCIDIITKRARTANFAMVYEFHETPEELKAGTL